MQTLPEFAVEAVLAWHQQVPSAAGEPDRRAAAADRARLAGDLFHCGDALIAGAAGQPLRRIRLEEHHSVEVVGLLSPLLYVAVIVVKGSLTIYDGAVLIVIYAAYLWILTKLPAGRPRDHRGPGNRFRAPSSQRRACRGSCHRRPIPRWGRAHLLQRRALPGQPAGALRARGVPDFVFMQWVAPAGFRIPRNGVDHLLGAPLRTARPWR